MYQPIDNCYIGQKFGKMKEEVTEKPIEIKIEHFFKHQLLNLLNEGASIAAYRLPGESDFYLMGNKNGFVQLTDEELEQLQSGFVISNFDGDRFHLISEYIWNSSQLSSSAFDDDKNTNNSDLYSNFHINNHQVSISSPQDYVNFVRTCVSEIQTEEIQKIVPARVAEREIPQQFDLPNAFLTLCKKYPNAFVSLVSSPQTGTWMGASPEILVSTKDPATFQTVAVAGTQPYMNQALSQVAWTQKEIEEQAMVSRYIINCFKKIRLREFDEHGPKTVIAGNLLHLKTTFTVDMNATNFPQLGGVMVKLLHPTSAVCGMPLEAARSFLKENEPFDRSFFSGYLGPVNTENSTQLFVNIRCMEIQEGKVRLFAGAGVTADSIPEMELKETEIKFETMGSIL